MALFVAWILSLTTARGPAGPCEQGRTATLVDTWRLPRTASQANGRGTRGTPHERTPLIGRFSEWRDRLRPLSITREGKVRN